jgi:hypothetical protein
VKFIPHLVGRDVRPFQRAAKRDGPSRKRKGKNLLLLTYELVYLEQSLAATSQKKINKSTASSKCTYSRLICLNLYD